MMDQNERFREYTPSRVLTKNVIRKVPMPRTLAAYRNALAGSVQTASANDALKLRPSITGKVARVNANATLDDTSRFQA